MLIRGLWVWPVVVGMVLRSMGSAGADSQDLNRLLHGDYAEVGTGGCLYSPLGFNDNLTPRGSSFVNSFNAQGIRTFNGDGTGTVRIRNNVSVAFSFVPFGTPGASATDTTAPFTYSVAPDGSFSMVTGPLTGTILTGSRAGQTITISPISEAGLIAKDNQSLTYASDTTQVKIITFSNGDSFPRICQRSRVLLRLRSEDD